MSCRAPGQFGPIRTCGLARSFPDRPRARARGRRGLQASGRLSSLHLFGYAKNRTAYRFRDKSVLRSLTRALDQSPIATAVRAVFTDMPPGKYADT
jgi:hypothetical protein